MTFVSGEPDLGCWVLGWGGGAEEAGASGWPATKAHLGQQVLSSGPGRAVTAAKASPGFELGGLRAGECAGGRDIREARGGGPTGLWIQTPGL